MADDEITTVVVSLTSDEVKLIMQCLLHCPVTTTVAEMPNILGKTQGILKKLTLPSPPPPAPPPLSTMGEGGTASDAAPPRWREES